MSRNKIKVKTKVQTVWRIGIHGAHELAGDLGESSLNGPFIVLEDRRLCSHFLQCERDQMRKRGAENGRWMGIKKGYACRPVM